MILPTKHIPSNDSLVAVGATLLDQIRDTCTVTELWDTVRLQPGIVSFERFTFGLDLLYAIGLVELDRGQLKRV